MKTEPLIIYIPGLLPKPEAGLHRHELLRCLLEGIRRIDPATAENLRDRAHCFEIVSWTYEFYGQHRDAKLDRPGIEALLKQQRPTERDIAEAVSWKRRLVQAIYTAGDILPFLIPKLADKNLEVHLRDLRRYTNNDNGVAESIRCLLKRPLAAAAAAGRRVLLLAHSMGSVIAYDALWQLSRGEPQNVSVDRLITLGSPLGQRYIQGKLQGRKENGELRYPANIGHWVNISAIGELTALDTELRNDFREMETLGLLDQIKDMTFFNYFRQNDALNVHSEYGYLISEVTARQVRDWWCRQR